ncbi:MAG: hypothetical protein AVDCRST_MAG22-3576 [uncultured Rubrobacteraceae bacterium]|uniref:Uncharacterized protein n=1 Tax=uncultured Rubrobacteraceae bacterium TaxID=349277 RepID=A0A6J4QAI9_9ACTN|nr:MAG: hypothetical protein AVDCRST_MAG22-3576 [uncultured Rubrobacteraceae bacterium]
MGFAEPLYGVSPRTSGRSFGLDRGASQERIPLAQQLKALREHTAREGREVAEEISGQRQSGAFTAAPDAYLNGSR